ncbi:hypothetical protein CR513_35805, partial [Mucuna pruriens]
MAHIHKYAAKARVAKRYNVMVFPHLLQKGDLVLRRIVKGETTNKGEGGSKTRSIQVGVARRKIDALHLEYNYFEEIL